MLQSILLPEADVVSLRAAIAHPLFAPLLAAAPGLATSLQYPQPDFASYFPHVYSALAELRRNAIYPGAWDDLTDAVDETRRARIEFSAAAMTIPTAVAPAPLRAFVLVEEHMGSNDGVQFGKTAYLDFAAACGALKSRAEADHDPELDDDLMLEEYGSAETSVYGLNLLTKRGSVRRQYFVKGFDLVVGQAEAVEVAA
jgi:hypothetical protein